MNEFTDINRAAFKDEAYDHLAELETFLLNLEQKPDSRDLIDRIFRAIHTIKGSGAMFGFNDIAAFAHDVENVLDGVRNGQIAVDGILIDLTLAAKDHIKFMLEFDDGGPPVDAQITTELQAAFRAYPRLETATAPAQERAGVWH